LQELHELDVRTPAIGVTSIFRSFFLLCRKVSRLVGVGLRDLDFLEVFWRDPEIVAYSIR
jgi:hypothetical protein